MIGFQKLFDTETSYTEIPKFWDEICDKYAKNVYAGNEPANPCEKALVDNCIGEYGVCIDDVGEGKFRYLIAGGYKKRDGKNWVQASVRTVLANSTYTGVLRSGESRSGIIPELQIISPEQYETAQEIFAGRSQKDKDAPRVPLNTRGKSLLAGNVFCGHCGSRLNLTTNGRYRKNKDGSIDNEPRVRYTCYGKSRKRTECDGQTGYTMTKLDETVDKLIKQIFQKMKRVPKSRIISARYEKELAEKKKHLSELKNGVAEAQKNLDLLKAEIIRCLEGKSNFTSEMLSKLISEAETELQNFETRQKELKEKYDILLMWSDLYKTATGHPKKSDDFSGNPGTKRK